MSDETFYDRVKDLYRMLFEMATGNLSFRLPEYTASDDLSKLITDLNTLAAQFHLAIKKSGFVVPYYTFQNLAQYIFLLDCECKILGYSSHLPKLLGYPIEELEGMSFLRLLEKKSVDVWELNFKEMRQHPELQIAIPLEIVTAENKIVPLFITCSKLLFTNTIFVSAITTSLMEFAELNRNSAQMAKAAEAATIQNLYEYIMANLEKPLPTLKELSQLFQTNEFKLKEGFRHFFKTSIYQLYNEERLKRAYHIIQQSDLPLKSVSLMSGFKDYITFSKAFKKKFGYPPGDVKRHKD